MPDDDSPIKYVPISQLHQEPGARELTESPEMEPYLNFAAALMQGNDPEPELDALRHLPLEERLRLAGGFGLGLGVRRFG
ncbi:MAG: hypothetical protein ABSG56_14725 [Bryobacteraceae bacterium]|jgi:hypothetical protein